MKVSFTPEYLPPVNQAVTTNESQVEHTHRLFTQYSDRFPLPTQPAFPQPQEPKNPKQTACRPFSDQFQTRSLTKPLNRPPNQIKPTSDAPNQFRLTSNLTLSSHSQVNLRLEGHLPI